MASYPPENNHILPENSRPVSTIEEKESKINSMFSAISDKSKIDVEIKISMAEIGEMSGDRDEPEINRLLSLIISTFYSNKEFFVYEIIKNSSELLRFESLIDKIKPELFIRIVPVHFNTALSVIDPKVGADVSVIGKFRVGLYSAYLVAERVVVTTKHNDDVQYIWVSQAGGSFTVTRNINGQPLGRGTKITLFIKDDPAIRKFADVNLLPDQPIFERGGDEEESDSSEIFRERIPPDVAEGPGGVEVDEEVESQIQKFLEEKEIIIYEEQDGGELEQLAEFTLFGVKGYYTFAKKVRSCYPNRVEGSIAHVLWPWWPEYQDVSYRGGAGRLDPLRLWWDEFAERLDHVIVHKRQENIPVVFLRKCGNQPVLLDIPKSSITSKKRLDQIIHFYSASYGRKEPYDGGESPLDPWFGYIISYKNLNFQTLDWEEEFFEPWELQTQGEQFGEEDRGGEVEDGGVVEEHVIEEEIHEEDRVEWNEFFVSLKYINVMPLDNPEQDQAFKSSIKRRRI